MKFSPSTYDKLKFLTQIVLPAVATLYFTLAGLWGLPKAEEVVGTIVAIDAFLGVILQISSSKWAAECNGEIDVITSPEGVKTFSLNVPGDIDNLDQREAITFKVNKPKE